LASILYITDVQPHFGGETARLLWRSRGGGSPGHRAIVSVEEYFLM